MTIFQPMDRLNWYFVVVGLAADFHSILLVHPQEVHQVVGMSAVDQVEVDHEAEVVEHIREERTTAGAAEEFERLVCRSFVCFGEMMFDLAEARREDTCSGCKLLALVDPTVEGQSEIRRIDLSWISVG